MNTSNKNYLRGDKDLRRQLFVARGIDIFLIVCGESILPVEVRVLGLGKESSHVDCLKLIILYLAVHYRKKHFD
jgi:hypothetical protein